MRVKCTAPCLVYGVYHEAGDEFDWDGPLPPHMQATAENDKNDMKSRRSKRHDDAKQDKT